MKRLCLLVLVLVAASLTPTDAQFRRAKLRTTTTEGPGGGGGACVEGAGPLGANVHPRILVNECTLATYQAMFGTGGRYAPGSSGPDFQELITALDTNWEALDDSSNTNPAHATSLALVYVTYGPSGLNGVNYHGRLKAAWGARAIEVMEAQRVSTGGQLGDTNHIGLALAYDWVYDAMSAGQRQTWANVWEDVCDADRWSWSVAPYAPIAVSQPAMSWSMCMVAAIATSGNGYQDAWATGYLGEWSTRIRGDTGVSKVLTYFMDATNAAGGDLTEGTSYGHEYVGWYIALAEAAYQSAKSIQKATHFADAEVAWMRYWPKWWSYNIVPNANYLIGPWYTAALFAPNNTSANQIALQAVMYATEGLDSNMRNLAEWHAANTVGRPSGASIGDRAPYFFALASASTPTATSAETLGLDPYPDGTISRLYLRENYSTTGGPLVILTKSKWTSLASGIAERCPGNFEIWLNGRVTGKKVPHGGHQWAGVGRNSCNAMNFHDTSVAGPPNINYFAWGGGRQIYTNYDSLADLTTNSTWDALGTVRQSIRSGSNKVTYLFQDLSRAYAGDAVPDGNGYNADCVDTYGRTFILFHANAAPTTDKVYLAVYDRVVTNATTCRQTDVVNWNVSPTFNDGSTSAGPSYAPDCAKYAAWTAGNVADCPSTSSHGWTNATDATLLEGGINAGGINNRMWLKYFTTGITIVRAGGPDESANTWDDQASPWSLEHSDMYGVRMAHGASNRSSDLRPMMMPWATWVYPTVATLTSTLFKIVSVGRDADADPTYSARFTSGAGTGWECAIVDSLYAACFGENSDSKSSGAVVWNTNDDNVRAVFAHLTPSTTRTLTPGSNVNLGAGLGVAVTCTVGASGHCEIADIDTAAAGTGAANTITVS